MKVWSIAPASVPAFVVAQVVGAMLAADLAGWWRSDRQGEARANDGSPE